MNAAQEAKIDQMSETLTDVTTKVGDIHKVLYEEGLVHEVEGLVGWKKSVNSVLLKIGQGITMLLIGLVGAAIVYYIKNSP